MRSSDPDDPPLINPRYLTKNEDVLTLVEGTPTDRMILHLDRLLCAINVLVPSLSSSAANVYSFATIGVLFAYFEPIKFFEQLQGIDVCYI